MKTIVLDFDETLFSTARETRMFLNARFGTQIPIDNLEYMCGHSLLDLVMHYAPAGFSITQSALYEILGAEFIASPSWHKDVCPIEGAQEVVNALARDSVQMYVATARQTTSRPVVEMLLEKFFPGCISGIHFVWTHLGKGEFAGVPKKEFIRRLGKINAYVDDNPKETKEILGLANQVLLFDPRGHHVDSTDFTHRVVSWEGVKNILL